MVVIYHTWHGLFHARRCIWSSPDKMEKAFWMSLNEHLYWMNLARGRSNKATKFSFQNQRNIPWPSLPSKNKFGLLYTSKLEMKLIGPKIGELVSCGIWLQISLAKSVYVISSLILVFIVFYFRSRPYCYC